MSERRADLETPNARADLPDLQGRPPLGEQRATKLNRSRRGSGERLLSGLILQACQQLFDPHWISGLVGLFELRADLVDSCKIVKIRALINETIGFVHQTNSASEIG